MPVLEALGIGAFWFLLGFVVRDIFRTPLRRNDYTVSETHSISGYQAIETLRRSEDK